MIRKEFLFKSASTDKTIIIMSGLHGDQQTSVYALDELIHNLETKTYIPIGVKKIIVYNYINLDGILTRQRLCKNIDLNRDFSQICSSNKDIQHIKQDVVNADIIIDMHSSFNSTEFFFVDYDKYAVSYIQFLKKRNLNFVVSPNPNINTMKSFINNKYPIKVGFTLQLNQNGNNIDVASALRGISMIKKVIDNCFYLKKAVHNLPQQSIKAVTLTADITGLLKINDILGKTVQRGDKLGYILSLDKTRMINIIAPVTGKVIVYPAFMTYAPVNSAIMTIQPN